MITQAIDTEVGSRIPRLATIHCDILEVRPDEFYARATFIRRSFIAASSSCESVDDVPPVTIRPRGAKS